MVHPATRWYHTRVLTPRPYSPHGFEPAAFKELVIGSGVYETGFVTAWEADLMIGRAAAKGRLITAREYGALHIAGRVSRSRTLNMVIHPKNLTPRQAEDLALIERNEHRAHFVRDARGLISSVDAGMIRIPRVQTSILLERGWLSHPPHSDKVWISAAGRMAMAHRWLREQRLTPSLLKGLYLDAALTAAATAVKGTRS